MREGQGSADTYPKSAVLRYVSVSVGSARRFPNRRQSSVLLELSQQQLQIARNADATKPLDVGARMNFTAPSFVLRRSHLPRA